MMKTLLLILCVVSISVNAEDIQIYTDNKTPPLVKTNILMVYDLSTSMKEKTFEVLNPYDSTVTYSNGPGKQYDNSYYYVVSAVVEGNPAASVLIDKIKKDKFHCDSMKADLAIFGWAADRFSRHRNSPVIPLLWTGSLFSINTDFIECREDAGLHGKNSDSTDKKWAAKDIELGKNAWTNNQEDAVTWNDTFSSAYVIYTANYMRWYKHTRLLSSNPVKTRMQILKEATKQMVDTTGNMNIGILSTNRNSKGGSVNSALKDIDAVSLVNAPLRNRDDVKSVVDGLHTTGVIGLQGSPLTETLWEANAYYSGADVFFGDKGAEGVVFGDPADRSVDASRKSSNSSQYKSPITESCQVNAQVIFTDGTPTLDSQADGRIQGLIGGMTEDQRDSRPYELSKGCGTWFNSAAGGFLKGVIERRGCLSTLAWSMNNGDLNNMLAGDQQVKTFAIGGFMRSGLADLRKAAQYGGGRFYMANDTTELKSVLDAVLIDVLDLDSGFAAPAVSVNAFNELKHNDELYYALFKPQGSKRWQGNLKKYKLGKSGVRDLILDKNGSPAINDATGFFNHGITSYWSGAADGAEVEKGGAASQLDSPRSLFTYLGDYADASSITPVALEEVTASISKTALGDGVMTNEYRSELIKYSKGINQSSIVMGDAIHSEPIVLTHGGTAVSPQGTVFMGTNNGFIHGIDTQTGETQFSFVPKELLPNLNDYFMDSASTEKTYGMDGPLMAWIQDSSGVLKYGLPISTDKVSLLAGMRRGGRNYYMLDLSEYVQDTTKVPKLKWVIEGGQGSFVRLGQTWAAPKLIKMKINGVSRNLLVIAGGYDPEQDKATQPTPDTVGNAIYLIDANTGQLVWTASPDASAQLTLSNMQNGFISSVSPIDVDSDGHVETIFAADIGGHLWRFDFDKGNKGTGSNDKFATGGMIAKVSGSGAGVDELAANNRRFSGGVSVALAMDSGGKRYFTLAIGTGFRPEPLSDVVQNRFYVFKDTAVGIAPSSYSKIEHAGLYDASLNMAQTGTAEEKGKAIKAMASAPGWFIDLRPGEKIFDSPTTYDGNFLFTTFRKSGSALTCGADTGTGAFYMLGQATGTGALGSSVGAKRSKDLNRAGIPSKVVSIFKADGVVAIVGTEVIQEASGPRPYQKTYWYEAQ